MQVNGLKLPFDLFKNISGKILLTAIITLAAGHLINNQKPVVTLVGILAGCLSEIPVSAKMTLFHILPPLVRAYEFGWRRNIYRYYSQTIAGFTTNDMYRLAFLSETDNQTTCSPAIIFILLQYPAGKQSLFHLGDAQIIVLSLLVAMPGIIIARPFDRPVNPLYRNHIGVANADNRRSGD